MIDLISWFVWGVLEAIPHAVVVILTWEFCKKFS